MKDGDPAFPITESVSHAGHPGMSLRHYFASQAMQALLTNPKLDFAFRDSDDVPCWNEYFGEESDVHAKTMLARMAFEAADAMLLAAGEVQP